VYPALVTIARQPSQRLFVALLVDHYEARLLDDLASAPDSDSLLSRRLAAMAAIEDA
jgi:hypothetical protein